MTIIQEAGLINSRVMVTELGASEVMNGRLYASNEARYILRGFLTRAMGEGTDDGELPSWGSRASSGGGVTSVFLYRGYITEYATVSSNYEFSNYSTDQGLVYRTILSESSYNPRINIYRGMPATLRHGSSGFMETGSVVIFGGRYGGSGIDEILYKELRAIPIIIKASSTN